MSGYRDLTSMYKHLLVYHNVGHCSCYDVILNATWDLEIRGFHWQKSKSFPLYFQPCKPFRLQLITASFTLWRDNVVTFWFGTTWPCGDRILCATALETYRWPMTPTSAPKGIFERGTLYLVLGVELVNTEFITPVHGLYLREQLLHETVTQGSNFWRMPVVKQLVNETKSFMIRTCRFTIAIVCYVTHFWVPLLILTSVETGTRLSTTMSSEKLNDFNRVHSEQPKMFPQNSFWNNVTWSRNVFTLICTSQALKRPPRESPVTVQYYRPWLSEDGLP